MQKIFFESLHFSLTILHHISKIWRRVLRFWSILILAMCVLCLKSDFKYELIHICNPWVIGDQIKLGLMIMPILVPSHIAKIKIDQNLDFVCFSGRRGRHFI